MRKKEKIKLLEFEITNMTLKLAHLRNEKENMINYTKKLETSLKSMSNEILEHNKEITKLKTKIILLKRDILSESQIVEIRDNTISKLEEEKLKQNEMIKDLVKENHRLKDLVKTNKDARVYLKGKSERE